MHNYFSRYLSVRTFHSQEYLEELDLVYMRLFRLQ